MKNIDIIFILKNKELARYDLKNSFKEELEETRNLLAYENKCEIKDIKIFYQEKNLYSIKLYRGKTFNIYGEYEYIDYKNLFSILSDCIIARNTASIKVNNKNYYIGSNDNFRYFIEEYEPKSIESLEI